uniref:Uncharacterized protein n=1 Tax=Meloidogyne incognita TaxID=6306 RepID=A0A914KV75_MELIC
MGTTKTNNNGDHSQSTMGPQSQSTMGPRGPQSQSTRGSTKSINKGVHKVIHQWGPHRRMKSIATNRKRKANHHEEIAEVWSCCRCCPAFA